MHKTSDWVELPVQNTQDQYLIWDTGWSHRYEKAKNEVEKEASSQKKELEGAYKLA